MASRTIYFDESGFTGYNLLDDNQPIFVIASSDISPEISEAALCASFPRYQGPEFKFSNIWGTRSKTGLVELARRISDIEPKPFLWMVEKKFAVLTKIVDFLVEPYMTDAGYDFYSDGFCWKYSNYIHFGLRQFGSSELFDALVSAYQRFSRDPTLEELNRLCIQLGIMAASVEPELRIFLEQMAVGAKLFPKFHNLSTFKGSDELQVTSLLACIAYWRQRFTEDFAVVHDASANFFRRRDLWERVTNSNVPAQVHPLGDGTMVQFPLRVISTSAVDSRENPSVQLCDVLAGLAARHFSGRLDECERALINDALEAGFGQCEFNGIRPATIFPDQIPPRRLSGPDAVDRLTNIMYGPHNVPKGS